MKKLMHITQITALLLALLALTSCILENSEPNTYGEYVGEEVPTKWNSDLSFYQTTNDELWILFTSQMLFEQQARDQNNKVIVDSFVVQPENARTSALVKNSTNRWQYKPIEALESHSFELSYTPRSLNVVTTYDNAYGRTAFAFRDHSWQKLSLQQLTEHNCQAGQYFSYAQFQYDPQYNPLGVYKCIDYDTYKDAAIFLYKNGNSHLLASSDSVLSSTTTMPFAQPTSLNLQPVLLDTSVTYWPYFFCTDVECSVLLLPSNTENNHNSQPNIAYHWLLRDSVEYSAITIKDLPKEHDLQMIQQQVAMINDTLHYVFEAVPSNYYPANTQEFYNNAAGISLEESKPQNPSSTSTNDTYMVFINTQSGESILKKSTLADSFDENFIHFYGDFCEAILQQDTIYRACDGAIVKQTIQSKNISNTTDWDLNSAKFTLDGNLICPYWNATDKPALLNGKDYGYVTQELWLLQENDGVITEEKINEFPTSKIDETYYYYKY